MKYNTYSISAGLVIFASLAPGIIFAENNVGFGVGSGGQAGAVNISIDYSKFTTDKHLNYIFGCGFSAIFNNDNVPGEILDYSIPHYDYHVIHKQPNPEYAFYTKLGIEPIPGSGLFVFGTGGVSIAEKEDIAVSNATGWLYKLSSTSKYSGLFGGGAAFYPNGSRISLQCEYDNRRGVVGSVGYRW